MTTNTEKILDKVRKLLAKAQGTTNEAEAAAFSAKAHELLIEHSLSMTDLEKEEELQAGVGYLTIHFKDNCPWTRQLAAATARYYMCGFASKGSGWNLFHFIGRQSRAAVASEMFIYLHKTVKRLARRHSNVGRYRNAFERGCGLGLVQRLSKLTAEAKGQPDSSGLPALYDAAEAELRALMEGLKVKKSVSKTGHGFHAGMEAANTVSLNTQVTSTAKAEARALSNTLLIGRN